MQQTALSESFLPWLLVSTLYFKKIFFICLIVLFKLNSHDRYLVPRAQGTELVLAWTVQESHLPTLFSIMWNRTLSLGMFSFWAWALQFGLYPPLRGIFHRTIFDLRICPHSPLAVMHSHFHCTGHSTFKHTVPKYFLMSLYYTQKRCYKSLTFQKQCPHM